MDILDSTNVNPALADMIETYLLNQGCRTIAVAPNNLQNFWRLAISIDNLGWDCFVEGRLPSSLIDVIETMLH
jgi:hypothetical protein